MVRLSASISSLLLAASLGPAFADVSQQTIDALGAPDSAETRIGTLEFKDGVPTDATAFAHRKAIANMFVSVTWP